MFKLSSNHNPWEEVIRDLPVTKGKYGEDRVLLDFCSLRVQSKNASAVNYFYNPHLKSLVFTKKSVCPIITVPTQDLVLFQSSVSRSRLLQFLADPEFRHPKMQARNDEYPYIIKYSNNYLVHDGNHRVTAAFIRNAKQVKVRLFDLDKELAEKPTICIDFNGVLAPHDDAHASQPPLPHVVEFLKNLHEKYKVVIFTCCSLKKVKQWVKSNGLDKYIEDVTNIKIPAKYYIDDKAIEFKDNHQEVLKKVSYKLSL